MRRKDAMAVAVLLAGVVVSGTQAAMRTIRLGAAAAAPGRVPDAVIAARRARLDRFSASLARTRGEHPPALPLVPHYAAVAVPVTPPVRAPASASAPPAQSETPAVRYVRAAPVVQTVQAPPVTTTSSSSVGGDDDGGTDDGGGGDD
jgi:hypothetical protein